MPRCYFNKFPDERWSLLLAMRNRMSFQPRGASLPYAQGNCWSRSFFIRPVIEVLRRRII